MAYPFVPAAHRYGPRKGPMRAFLIHMAEGGGTVGYLSRPNLRGVSVHYVIEYTGRIVQMLREDEASGSVNPDDIRTDNGPAPYGARAAKAVMGAWWGDPNAAVISCEIEGFASKGPNIAQRNSLASLVADVRSRYPRMGLLGHRDFADYKACPGASIPWPKLGGHGTAQEVDVPGIEFQPKVGPAGTFTYTKAGGLIDVSTGAVKPVNPTVKIVTVTGPALITDSRYPNRKAYLCDINVNAMLILADQGTFVPAVIPADCAPIQAELDASEARAAAAIVTLGGTP